MSNLEKANQYFNTVCQATEEVLTTWNFNKTLKFPELLELVCKKISPEPKDIKYIDTFIRFYTNTHARFHVSRGAGCGITTKAKHQEKLDALSHKNDLKSEILAEIEAKLAQENLKKSA